MGLVIDQFGDGRAHLGPYLSPIDSFFLSIAGETNFGGFCRFNDPLNTRRTV